MQELMIIVYILKFLIPVKRNVIMNMQCPPSWHKLLEIESKHLTPSGVLIAVVRLHFMYREYACESINQYNMELYICLVHVLCKEYKMANLTFE